MRNLIFVGLPGSGKSTVGRLAAKTLGLPFVDADKALEILKANGEDAYIMGEIVPSEEGVLLW